MANPTTNLGLTKPEVGGSTDEWGEILNDDVIDVIDDVFASAGTPISLGNVGVDLIAIEAQGDIRLGDAASTSASGVLTGDYTAIQAAATIDTSYTITLPAAVGADKQYLRTDGTGGVLEWVTDQEGDITAIVAGAGLTGTDLSGPIPTLNVIGTSGTITVSADAVTIASDYVGQSTITTTGALDTGSITSGFTSIDVGSGAITTTGTVSGTTLAGTLSTAAQTNVTSLGTLTALQVDNININLNTISSTAGTDLNITPLTGQQIVLDGTIVIDAGVVTGATSITSTAFVGALTGDASGTSATVTGATQAAITTAANLVTVGALDSGSITSGFTSIDVGSGAITTTGTVSATTLTGTLSTASQGNLTTASALVTVGALDSGSITSGFGTINTGSSSITGGAGSFTTISGSTSLALATGETVTGIDNATLATGSATLLATQGAIKTYVDSQVGAADALDEVLANGNETDGTDLVVTNGDTLTTNTILETTTDAGVTIELVKLEDNVVTATTFTGALVGNASTATTAATVTGATQAAITSAANLATVGTIGTGVWEGTTVAVDQGGTGVTSSTGSGSVVLSTSPVMITPALGTPSALVLTNATALPADQVAQGTMASGMVLVAPALGTPASGVMTNVTGTASSLTAGAVTNGVYTTSKISALAATTSAELKTVISDETGTGSLVFATSPTLVTPVLGTPASGTATNITGLPIVAGTTGTLTYSRGGTGQTTYAKGDIVIADAADSLAKLAAGSTGQILTVASGAPAWADPSASTVAPAGTLTGTTLNSTVVTSSLTSVGTLSSLGVGAITSTGDLAVTGTSAGSDVATFTGQAINTTANLSIWERSGGAVASEMKYVDSSTDMEFGTSTAHAFSLKTGDTRALTIDSSQNVIISNGRLGVGATSGSYFPAQTLDIVGTVIAGTPVTDATNKQAVFLSRQYDSDETEGFMMMETFSNSTTNRIDIGGGNSTANAATSIEFFTAANNTTRTGTARMFITTDGDVGMKESVPESDLHVAALHTSRNTIARPLYLESVGSGAGANPYAGFGVGIQFQMYDYANYVEPAGAIDCVMEASNRNSPAPDDGFTSGLVFSTVPLQASGITNQMWLKANGDLGLGVSAPESHLHIAETASTGLGPQITLDNTAAAAVGNAVEIAFLTDSGASGTGTRNARILAECNNASDGAASLQFHSWDGSASAERMRIADDGNVGIGTTVPTASLQVGTITDTSESAASAVHILSSTAPSTVNGFATLKLDYKAGGAPSTAGAQIMFNQGYHSSNPDFTQPVGAIRGWKTGADYGYGGGLQFLYQEDAGALGLDVGMTLTGGGKVGIGTTTPAAPLTIKQGSADYYGIVVEESASDAWVRIGHNGTQGTVETTYNSSAGATPLSLGTHNYPNQVYLKTDGNVGINVTDPQAQLHIKNTSGTEGFMVSRGTKKSSPTMHLLADSATNFFDFYGPLSIRGVGTDTNPTALERMSISDIGTVDVNLVFTAGTKTFKIDHPLPEKKDTHHLYHSSIEGPKADLIYRGVAELSGGYAQVDLDEAAGMTEGTLEALCRVNEAQCWIQNDSGWSSCRGAVEGNTLTIECKDVTSDDTVSWMVVAERCDPHIMESTITDNEGRLIVEPEKPEEEE